METCADPQKTVKCNENFRYKDCGQLKDSKFKNFGCQYVDSETVDYFECSNRMDKSAQLFTKPPVATQGTIKLGTNYNEVLNFSEKGIHCGHLDIPWEKFREYQKSHGSENCLLNNGKNVTIAKLWLNLLRDYSFKMSPKMDEL